MACVLVSGLKAAPGDLDTSFGSGGKVVTSIGSGDDRAHAMVMQGDGKLVVAGYSYNGSNNDFCVVRYNEDGTLDTDFGTGGKVLTDFGGTNDEANGVAVQTDGRIVVVGGALSGSTSKVFALARYHPDGTLDTSFGPGATGKIKTAIGSTSPESQAWAVAVLADGKILVAGHSLFLSIDYVLARYTSDGSLDLGFGNGGVAALDQGSNDYASNLAVQADGRVVMSGYGYSSGYFNSSAGRFTADGLPDASFAPGTSYLYSYGVAVQADGKIILAGANLERNPIAAGSQDYRLIRYHPSGALDTTFGTGGTVTTAIGTAQDLAYDVKVQSDGRIVAAGYSYNANTNFNDFAVVRYNTNGTLDASFQSTGKVTTSFSGGSAMGRGMAIAPDGRIIVAGYAHDGTCVWFPHHQQHASDQRHGYRRVHGERPS